MFDLYTKGLQNMHMVPYLCVPIAKATANPKTRYNG